MRNEVRQDKIVGSRRFSNYFWSFSLCWGLRFLLAGISSYFKINLLPFTNTTELVLYHRFSDDVLWNSKLRISISIILTISLDIGSGYNKIENLVKIVRKGLGKTNSFNVPISKCSSNWNKNHRRIESNSKYLLMFER
jgi:hypothetical protein